MLTQCVCVCVCVWGNARNALGAIRRPAPTCNLTEALLLAPQATSDAAVKMSDAQSEAMVEYEQILLGRGTAQKAAPATPTKQVRDKGRETVGFAHVTCYVCFECVT